MNRDEARLYAAYYALEDVVDEVISSKVVAGDSRRVQDVKDSLASVYYGVKQLLRY